MIRPVAVPSRPVYPDCMSNNLPAGFDPSAAVAANAAPDPVVSSVDSSDGVALMVAFVADEAVHQAARADRDAKSHAFTESLAVFDAAKAKADASAANVEAFLARRNA